MTKSPPRVLLVNPPQSFSSRPGDFELYVPIGLLSVAAAIRDSCQVSILDCPADASVEEREGFRVRGTPLSRIEVAIAEFAPDIVGISIPFSSQAAHALSVARACRKAAPKASIVFGGPDPSVRYEHYLRNGSCDHCVVGEGEGSFAEFVRRVKEGRPVEDIPGLASLDGARVLHAPRKDEEPDSLAFPAYDLVALEEYLRSAQLYQARSRIGRRTMSVITSRGCPYPCVFCSISLHMGKRFRGHSPEYMIRHLRLLKERHGILGIHFEDDNLAFDTERFDRLLDAMIEASLGLQWDVPNGMRLDTLTIERLGKMKKAGCVELIIAIESADAGVRDDIIGKPISMEDVDRVARRCRGLGIRLGAFYMIGLPGETLDTMSRTVDLALTLFRTHDVFPCLGSATPLYGTRLYDECVARGLIRGNLSNEELAAASRAGGRPLIGTTEFTPRDVQNLMAGYSARSRRAWDGYLLRHPLYALGRAWGKVRAGLDTCRPRPVDTRQVDARP